MKSKRVAVGWAGSLWLASMGLFLMLAGALFSYLLWNAYVRDAVSRDWPEVPGTIVVSRLIEHDAVADGQPRYSAKMQYRYRVAGKDYTSDVVRLKKRAPGQKDVAAEIVAQFPPASMAPVYVDPADPARAVLQKGGRGALFAQILPLLILVGGAGMAFSALRQIGGGRKKTS